MDNRFVSNLLKGVVSTSFGGVVTIGFHFVSIMLMTRYVSQDVLGLYFLASAVVQVLKIVSGLGLDLTLSKLVSGGDRHVQQDTVASTVVVRFISVACVGLIFYAAGRLILPIFDARLSDCIATMILLFALTGFRELFLNLIQGVQQFKAYAFVEVLSAAVRVVLLVAFRDTLSLQGLLVIDITAQFISFAAQLFVMRVLLLSLSRRNINRESLRELIRFSAPLYSNSIVSVIYDRSSTFLIGALLNPASVATYEVALKIPDAFMRFFNSFIVVYFPTLSNLFAKGNRDAARRIMNSSLVLLSAGIIFMVLVASLFGSEIVLALFSQEYLAVSLAFALLMLNFYLRAVSNILGYSLVSAGYFSAPVKANVVASIVNITGSLVLIRMLGYIGAVYSLLLMNITSQIMYEGFLRRAKLGPNLFEYLKPVLLLAAAVSIYLLFGAGSTPLKVVLLGAYVAGCWTFIKEIRDSSHSALKYVQRVRVRAKPA